MGSNFRYTQEEVEGQVSTTLNPRGSREQGERRKAVFIKPHATVIMFNYTNLYSL
jgi:hypothetical protein